MTVMTVEEAIAKIEEEKIFYHDGESNLCALCEAWQTLKTAVLAQQTNNKQSTPCSKCGTDRVLMCPNRKCDASPF